MNFHIEFKEEEVPKILITSCMTSSLVTSGSSYCILTEPKDSTFFSQDSDVELSDLLTVKFNVATIGLWSEHSALLGNSLSRRSTSAFLVKSRILMCSDVMYIVFSFLTKKIIILLVIKHISECFGNTLIFVS